MQSVESAFTAEEKDKVRKIAQGLLVSWKKDDSSLRQFTIGVSTIGGPDPIGINPGAIGGPGIFRYFNETEYALSLAWERGFSMPIGGLAKAYGEARLDNTTRRFTPRYMGGESELYTSILARRPMIITAGFNYGGVDLTIPQFSGILDRTPELDQRSREVRLHASDYIDFFYNRFLDREVMFTGQTTDQVLETILSELGMSTAQYELDPGINVIPFGILPVGSRFSDIVHKLVEAENGHFFQDEEGVFRFENRQHWDSSPYNAVQRVIQTAQVIESQSPNTDHIINVVEVKSQAMKKQPSQIIFRLNIFDSIAIPPNGSADFFANFDDAVLEITTPTAGGTSSYFKANTDPNGTGTNITNNVSITKSYVFAYAAKFTFTNTSANTAYLTELVITGRVAKAVSEIYTREQDSSSVTAYEERRLLIENEFIQNQDWAESYANMVLYDYAEPENLQRIVIRAMPTLQLGDLVSWQGRYWRIFDIKTTLMPATGFIQELTLLQRDITTYFRIGISTIGGEDMIAP